MQTDIAIKVRLGSTRDVFHEVDDCLRVEHYQINDPNISLSKLVRENGSQAMTTSLGSGVGTFIIAGRDSDLRLEQNGRVLFHGLMVEQSVLFVEGPNPLSVELQSDACLYVLTFLEEPPEWPASVIGGRFSMRDERLFHIVNEILDSPPTRRGGLASDFSTLAFERYGSLPRIHPLCAWRLNRVRRHLEACLDRQNPLAELAAIAGLSRAHFAATFKAATAISVHEFVLRMRVHSAAKLLACTELPIVDIALQTGFQNQPHFTTVFRKVTSLTPRRWRQLHRSAPASSGGRRAPSGSRVIEHLPSNSSDLH